MKAFILLLLSFPAWANHVEVSAVRVHENTMVVRGANLWKVQRATLGGKAVKTTMGGVDLVVSCRKLDKVPCANGRWKPGVYTLRLFKAGKALVAYPVTITGLEKQDRPTPPETIMPSPVVR